MGAKGLDFKHKEVINITDGRRLGFVQDVTANLESGAITSIIVPGTNKLLGFFLLLMILSFHGKRSNALVMMLFWSKFKKEKEQD